MYYKDFQDFHYFICQKFFLMIEEKEICDYCILIEIRKEFFDLNG